MGAAGAVINKVSLMFTEFSDVFMSGSYSELADSSSSVYEAMSIYCVLGSELSLMEDTEEEGTLPSTLIEEDKITPMKQ